MKTRIFGIYLKYFPSNKGVGIINGKIDFDKFVAAVNADREKYLRNNKYLNFCIQEMYNEDSNGNTHEIYLNTYIKDDE